MHDFCTADPTDPDLVNASDVTAAVAATFPAAGITPGTIVAAALADEPCWTVPLLDVPTQSSSVVRGRWVAYLQSRRLTPAALGSPAGWDGVVPDLTYDGLRSLVARRLFYWSIRFQHWDSCRYLAGWTAALQAGAKDPAMPVYVNWNNFDGRLYQAGAGPWAGRDPPVQGQLSYDWFEWARMKGGSVLWTEDWMPAADSHRWSYHAARMRSAIALSDHSAEMEFGGYVVAGSAETSVGTIPGALLLRPMTLAGSGSKVLRYYNFGPSYMFPDNSYSDAKNASMLFEEIAQANVMVARAERMLWSARRSPAQVAILFPRSSFVWDQLHYPGATKPNLCIAACSSSMIGNKIDYSAEVYGLYLALATDSNIPVDFVDEDALEEPEVLARYKLIWVTEPNLPAAGAAGLERWVTVGGTLATVSGAGVSDAYDEPAPALATLAGVTESSRDRIAIMSESDIDSGQSSPLPRQNGTATLTPLLATMAPLPFTAIGVVGKLAVSDPAVERLATFADGSPAITRNAVGAGRALHFAWLPGVSYWFSQRGNFEGKRPRDASCREIIARIAALAGAAAPVTASVPNVETPLMITPDGTGAVVTLLNFRAAGCTAAGCITPVIPALALNITLPFKPTRITSTTHGPLLSFSTRPTTTREGMGVVVAVTLPLATADFVLFEL